MTDKQLNEGDIDILLEALRYAKLNIENADYGGHTPELQELRKENLRRREKVEEKLRRIKKDLRG
jgi:hypothetical protein